MAKAWTCPACGAQNAMDAAECAACGRWASIFDLERADEVDEPVAYEAIRAEAPEPVVISETHVGAADRARAMLEQLRGTTGDTTAQEVDPPRAGHVLRWIFVGLAVLWFVVIPLLDQLR